MDNIIEFPDPSNAIEAEQRQKALGLARERLSPIAEAAVENGFQRMWEVTRSISYWETLTLDDHMGIIGEAFRTEFERRHMLPETPRTAQA